MRPTILVRSNDKGDLFEKFAAAGYPIVRMRLTYFNIFRWARFWRLLRNGDYHTVCDFNANFGGLTCALAGLAGVANRVAFYRQASDHFRQTWSRQIYNWLMKVLVLTCATRILSNSAAALDYFFGRSWRANGRYKVIYNGIDASSFLKPFNQTDVRRELQIPDDAFVVGHTGRYDKTKNHSTILRVAQKLIENDSKVFLVLSGRDTIQLASHCKSLGILSNVRLLGYRPDIPRILSGFDLFFFPSITEGLPNSLLEAMIRQVPIVASSIPPILEILPPEIHSFSSNPMDVDGFVDLITKVRNREVMYDTEAVARYALDEFNHVRRFDAFINELV